MLGQIIRLPNFGRAEIDMTGIGLGLVEFTQEEVGEYRVAGVHFASKEMRDPTKTLLGKTSHKTDSALVTELMALDLLELFEDGRIRIPSEAAYRDALRKPQRITTASGVRIAATSDEAGHADEFWAKALSVRALKSPAQSLQSVSGIRMGGNTRTKFKPRRMAGKDHHA
jgi:phage FluMu gp28-like protein